MIKNEINIAAFEHDIVWADKTANLKVLEEIASRLENTDILVLPEMFATGFTFDRSLAEEDDGLILTSVRCIAEKYNIAICGTFLASENENLYNRCFFVTPEGNYYKYDKRHLFCLSKEKDVITAGNCKTVLNYKGWNISLFVCYDLRFPVWMRNKNNIYDIAILPANWPDLREFAWKHLIIARSIENQSYVVAVNRRGYDDFNLEYSGTGMIVDYSGKQISATSSNLKTATLNYENLKSFRKKYQFWKDAD